MTKVLTIIYTTSHHHREKLFVLIVSALVVTTFVYVVLLEKAIVNVVQREKISHEEKTLTAREGDLEAKYFSIKNTITLDLAHSKGLRDAGTVSYISKRPVTAMVSHHEL